MPYDNGFAYAKAGGIIGKSFLGKRRSLLSGLNSLSELDKLVFPHEHTEIHDKQLLSEFKRKIEKRTQDKILFIINSYAPRVNFLVLAYKGYKYNELMDGTELDRHYYQELLESFCELDEEDRGIAQNLIADEICIRNCLWALRLRSYYNMTGAQTKKYLLDLKLHADIFSKKQSLAAKAKASLDFHLDIRQHWDGWKWEKFLNPQEDSKHWVLDPRHFQNSASLYLKNKAYHEFHSNPLTISAVYCFIKLMQYEEDLLISAAETIALGGVY